MSSAKSPQTKLKEERLQRLAEARAAESARKARDSLAAIQRLVENGQAVTFTAVARTAQVSTWLLYNNADLRKAVEASIAQQEQLGIEAAAAPISKRVSIRSLQADLAVARDQIKQLRAERDRYRRKAREALGASLEEVTAGAWSERLANANRQVAELQAELAAALDRAVAAEQRRDELMDDLTAARASLKKMIRTVPRG